MTITPYPLITLTLSAEGGPGFISLQPGETVNVCTEAAGLIACVFAAPVGTAEISDILDAAGIAPGPDVVGRVREVVGQISAITAVMRGRRELGDTMADRVAAVIACDDARGVVLGKCDAATSGVGVPVFGQAHDRVQWLAVRYSDALIEREDLSRRLDASEHDRVGLLATVETLRGERNSRSLAIRQCHTALTGAGVRQGDVVDRLGALIAERDAAHASRDRHCATIRECVGLLDTAGVARGRLADRVRALAEERDAPHAPKVAAVEWDGDAVSINGQWFARVWTTPDECRVQRAGGACIGRATDEPSARKLAELLAGHDPGGVWRVNGDVVSPDTVRMICPSVAVTWGES